MATVNNLQKVLSALRDAQGKYMPGGRKSNVRVVVGYTQSYAIYVHENRNAFHPVGKAGFLLDPARRLAGELARIVRTALRRGRTVSQALLMAGLRLQRESQQEVPVDTGALRASAYTRIEKV